MLGEILLKGDNGNYLSFKDVTVNSWHDYILTIVIASAWFTASIKCEIEHDDFIKFVNSLELLDDASTIFSTLGNFELTIEKADELGHFNVSGNMSPSMGEVSNIRYEFEVAESALLSLQKQLVGIINEH